MSDQNKPDRGDILASIKETEARLNTDPNCARTRYKLSTLHYKAGHFATAKATLQPLIDAGQASDDAKLLVGERRLTIQTDPHKCAFGKWYYGEGRKEAEKLVPELKGPMAEIEDPHRKLHVGRRHRPGDGTRLILHNDQGPPPAEQLTVELLRCGRVIGQQVAPDDLARKAFAGWRLGDRRQIDAQRSAGRDEQRAERQEGSAYFT